MSSSVMIQEEDKATIVQMHKDNNFGRNALFKSFFANGVVTCVVVMKCEWNVNKCSAVFWNVGKNTKLDRFLAKNQHIQRKSLYFVNRVNC